MTKLAILEYPDPRLRQTAEPVQVVDAEVRQLADDLLETMYASNGVGLAATQVDVHRRVLVLDVSESRNEPRVFINPRLISAEGLAPAEEGWELHNLTADPEERRNRATDADAAGVLEALRGVLDEQREAKRRVPQMRNRPA